MKRNRPPTKLYPLLLSSLLSLALLAILPPTPGKAQATPILLPTPVNPTAFTPVASAADQAPLNVDVNLTTTGVNFSGVIVLTNTKAPSIKAQTLILPGTLISTVNGKTTQAQVNTTIHVPAIDNTLTGTYSFVVPTGVTIKNPAQGMLLTSTTAVDPVTNISTVTQTVTIGFTAMDGGSSLSFMFDADGSTWTPSAIAATTRTVIATTTNPNLITK